MLSRVLCVRVRRCPKIGPICKRGAKDFEEIKEIRRKSL